VEITEEERSRLYELVLSPAKGPFTCNEDKLRLAQSLLTPSFVEFYGPTLAGPFAASRRDRLNDDLDIFFRMSPHGIRSPYTLKFRAMAAHPYFEIAIERNMSYKRPDIQDRSEVLEARKVTSVFLCHSSGDKERVRGLYKLLTQVGVAPWLDEQDLIPGQEWESEVKKAVRASDIVLVCLSKSSITKQGFVQKEIKFALDVADEKPPGTIYIIPARLEECEIPERLSKWHCVDFFKTNEFRKLIEAIRVSSERSQ
jgi:hypothetical protein